MDNNHYPIITLCGSTRFKEEFLAIQKALTLLGFIVLTVGVFGHSGDTEAFDDGTKKMLDDMHKRKIDLSEAIFVINKDGYIGDSTRLEIEYAQEHNKTVLYLDQE